MRFIFKITLVLSPGWPWRDLRFGIKIILACENFPIQLGVFILMKLIYDMEQLKCGRTTGRTFGQPESCLVISSTYSR